MNPEQVIEPVVEQPQENENEYFEEYGEEQQAWDIFGSLCRQVTHVENN